MIPRDQRGSGNGEFLFTWDRVSVWQDGKSLVDGWGEWLLNNENVINSTELYTYKQLRWYILWEGFGGGANLINEKIILDLNRLALGRG